VQRTHRALREALVSLILERGFEAISVQDVIDRADVGRSTFYAHFADKEDLLLSGFDDLRRALRAASPAGGEGPLAFTLGLAEHVHEQKRLFRALVGKRGGPPVQSRFRAMLIELIREDLAGIDHPLVEPGVQYLAGAFMEMLTWWVETRNGLTAQQFDQMFHELSAAILRRLTHRQS
jgi:AcrR family transcriptional regulator